jgi:hypothetical protein
MIRQPFNFQPSFLTLLVILKLIRVQLIKIAIYKRIGYYKKVLFLFYVVKNQMIENSIDEKKETHFLDWKLGIDQSNDYIILIL